jgi:hypothetical protein
MGQGIAHWESPKRVHSIVMGQLCADTQLLIGGDQLSRSHSGSSYSCWPCIPSCSITKLAGYQKT